MYTTFGNYYYFYMTLCCPLGQQTVIYIHTVVPPDDGPRYCRNMWRLTKYTKNKLCIRLVLSLHNHIEIRGQQNIKLKMHIYVNYMYRFSSYLTHTTEPVNNMKSYRRVLYKEVTALYCKEKNSVALVRERTIPTERPPPVGEVGANFCG